MIWVYNFSDGKLTGNIAAQNYAFLAWQESGKAYRKDGPIRNSQFLNSAKGKGGASPPKVVFLRNTTNTKGDLAGRATTERA